MSLTENRYYGVVVEGIWIVIVHSEEVVKKSRIKQLLWNEHIKDK